MIVDTFRYTLAPALTLGQVIKTKGGTWKVYAIHPRKRRTVFHVANIHNQTLTAFGIGKRSGVLVKIQTTKGKP